MVRLITFETPGKVDTRRIGALVENNLFVVDFSKADPTLPTSMREFLKGGDHLLQIANNIVNSGKYRIPVQDVAIRAPIYDPEKIVCIGLNYLDHARESGMALPPQPVFFAKYPSAIIGPEDFIVLPKIAPNEVDYEVELVIVIGKSGKNIPVEKALDHIVGWTVGHDVSARDMQLRRAGNQWIAGKTFDTFAPIGPAIVTKDEIENINNLGIRCILNGQIVQNSNTNQLAFKPNELVAYLSQHFTFQPGDLIFTGTPPGVGFARKPPIFLKPGDVVVCEIDKIGTLRNPVIAET